MNIGKWYDPISERWIVPRAASAVVAPPSSRDSLLDITRKGNAERIWSLLVDCCARG